MNRTLDAPIAPIVPTTTGAECGFSLDADGTDWCRQPSAYRFKLEGWPDWRYGSVCPEHAMVVRRWNVEWMRTR